MIGVTHMRDRQNFKNFIDDVVATYKTSNPNQKHDLRVDPYGNFEIVFKTISSPSDDESKFAESEIIKSFGNGLGELLFNKETKLHKFIKNINDVELNVFSKNLDVPGASYIIHRLMPMNSQPNLTLIWLNTKTPFIENVFVPWMKSNTLYGRFPLIKANLKITFPLLAENNSIEYWYYGVKPIEVSLHKMTNEPVQDFYRKITFDFDYFLIKVK